MIAPFAGAITIDELPSRPVINQGRTARDRSVSAVASGRPRPAAPPIALIAPLLPRRRSETGGHVV